MLQIYGYKYISNYLSYHEIKIRINELEYINAKIYKLSSNGEIEFEFKISDKLEFLIFLVISQYKLKNNKLSQVYLINPIWLKNYKYKKIKSLIYANYNKIPNIQNINDLNSVGSR